MTIHYSAATGGFYDTAIHQVLPIDAVEISAGDHADLVAAQAAGQAIVAGEGGVPIAVDRVPTRQQSLALLAGRRWQAQIVLPFAGHPASTDDVAAGRILTRLKVAEARSEPMSTEVYWKMADGAFIPLTLSQLLELLGLGADHVEACFGVEAVTAAQILAAPSDADAYALALNAAF